MSNRHQPIDFGNPLRNLAGNCHYKRKPSQKQVLEQLLTAMASSSYGCCWMPVEKVDAASGKAVAWSLMLKQCPGACGHVWKLILTDEDVAAWLVNEINTRRHMRTDDGSSEVKR